MAPLPKVAKAHCRRQRTETAEPQTWLHACGWGDAQLTTNADDLHRTGHWAGVR